MQVKTIYEIDKFKLFDFEFTFDETVRKYDNRTSNFQYTIRYKNVEKFDFMSDVKLSTLKIKNRFKKHFSLTKESTRNNILDILDILY